MTDGDPIADLTASRDLKAMVDAGLLEPRGAGRGRTYYGSEQLRGLWHKIQTARPPRTHDDPYKTLIQRPLPGISD